MYLHLDPPPRKHHILTASGVQFDLEYPTADMVLVGDIAGALSKLCRYTGHLKGDEFYSVAQHSVLVSNLVPEEFAFEGLLHDAAEAYIGDVSSPLKKMLADYRRVEHNIERVIRNKFALPPLMSPEVKKADHLALGIEARQFLPPDPTPWPDLVGLKLPDIYLTAQNPRLARIRWMDRFADLWYNRFQNEENQ